MVKELDFMNINYHNLTVMLEQDDLNVGETELFQALLRYGIPILLVVGINISVFMIYQLNTTSIDGHHNNVTRMESRRYLRICEWS